jgi:hypothetical protein
LVDQQTTSPTYRLETWFFPNDDIRKYLQDMKLGWTKYSIWNVNNKKLCKWFNFVLPILFNNIYVLPVLTKDTKCSNLVFYVWLVDLQSICAKPGLDTWFPPIDYIRKLFFDIRHNWTNNTFCEVNNKKWRKCLRFFLLFHLIKLMAYLCSQRTQNVPIKYFMFEWSIYR